MSRSIQFIAAVAISLSMAISSNGASPQVPSDDLARSVVDLKQRLENDASIVEPAKTDIAARLKVAEANLSKIEELNNRISTDQEAAATAGARSSGYRAELDKLENATPSPLEDTTELPEIESTATTLKAEVERLNSVLKENERESSRRTDRRQELRPLSDAADKLLNQTQIEIQALSSADNSIVTQTTRVVLLTVRQLAETEKSSYSAELTRYEKGDQEATLRNQRDLLTAQLAQSQNQLIEYTKRQTKLRQQEARETAKEAERAQSEKGSKNPLLVSSYEINTSLAKRVEAVEARSEEAKGQLIDLDEKVVEIGLQFQDTKKRIETIGLTESIGALMRRRKSELRNENQNFSDAEQVKSEMNDVQYEIFDMGQRRDELSQASIRKEIQQAYGPQDESVLEELEKPIDELIASRKEKLVKVKTSLERLLDQGLSEIEYKNRVLFDETKKFREYINERILWIRSNDLLYSTFEIDRVDLEVLKPSSWNDALNHVWEAILQSPIDSCLSAFAIALLILLKPKLRREVDKFGQIASRGSCDTLWPTIKTLVLTVLVALTVPLIPLLLGLLITGSTTFESPLFNALGPTLLAVAWFVTPFEILRQICKPNGLANEHFDWSNRSVAILRNNLRRMVIPGAVAVFLIALLRNLDQAHGADNIERSLFVIAMIGFAYYAWQTFSPKTGIFSEYLRNNERSWANQTAVLWFGMIVGSPILLALLTILGYYYTAVHLADRAFGTFVFAVIIETVRELLKRSILVRRRRVHIQAARRKHELQLQARQELLKSQNTEDASPLTESIPDPNDIEWDIDENAKQANKLVSLSMILVWSIGLWVIWADVMPALKALDNYTVWPADGEAIVESVENDSATPSAVAMPMAPGMESTAPTTETTKPAISRRISVSDLLMFLVITTVTLISARSLPGALEMLLLEQLPLDSSLRHAIKTLTSYAIVFIGLILAFRALSIDWDNVQWLATALTFGLAFGLQEIFANFVAGIILMFERPIRIGDLITVDDFTGVVTKIRTRATTIVNWDRKEYLIPNKDLVTGRLVNWTLSDTVNRLVITIGVAYGSDVEKAKSILLEICNKHPKISKDPATSVAFEQFADSSLNITIRAFLAEIDGRLKVIDDLHTQINAAFNEAGIVMPFPQRDLHICSVDELAAETIQRVQPTRDADESN